MSVVLGKNVALYAYYNGLNNVIACATNCVLTVTTDVAETTTVNSGTWKEYLGQATSWNVTVDGLIHLDVDFGIHNLVNLQSSLLPLVITFEVTDTDGNDVTFSGTVVIERTELSGPDNAAASFSASFIGSGELAVDSAPTNSGGVQIYDYEATGTEYEFSAADLVNKDVLVVYHDTDRFKVVTTSPANQVAKYTAASGTITFDHTLPAGMYIGVLYQ